MPKKTQAVTIYDIAEKAGVSVSTVSRVINEYPFVNKETRKKVQALLDEYHYNQNQAARGLATQTSKMVGILISDIRKTHHTDSIYYIEREFVHNDFCCLIFNTGTEPEKQAHYIQILGQRQVEAAVLIGSVYQSKTVKEAIEKYLPDKPIVIVNGYLDSPNVYGVIADEKGGVEDCVKLLMEKGCKHPAFIIDRYTPSNRLKEQGFKNGISQYFPGTAPIVCKTDETREGAYSTTVELLKTNPKTDGIIFADDALAIIGVKALTASGLVIPKDVLAIGINNSVLAENCTPSLTSLDNMLYDLSNTATRNILSALQGYRVSKKIQILSTIVERETT